MQTVSEQSLSTTISAAGAKSIGVVCLLLCVFASAVASGGSIAKPGSSSANPLEMESIQERQGVTGELKQGEFIEREISGGETHRYRIPLTSGQYLRARIEQKGIDVAAKLFGTEGRKLLEADNDSADGSKSVSVVAETSGDYYLEVGSQNKSATAGKYAIKIEEWREATPRDRDRFVAQKAFFEGNQLKNQGTAESSRKAIEMFEQALPLWRAVEDSGNLATTLNEIGFVYSGLGDTQKALAFYNQALPLFRAVRNVKQESIVLNNLGSVYARIGESKKALEYFSQALPLKRVIGDRKSEANTLHNMGFANSQLAQLQTALDYYNQALPLRRATGDRLGESITLNSMGSVYYKLGELQKALEYHSQGLALSRALADRRNEAVTLHNVGLVHSQLGEMQKALEYYNQALPLRRAVGDRYGEAYTLDSMGSVYVALGENQKALEYHNQSLQLRRAVGDKYGESYALSNIGSVYHRLGKIPEAIDYSNQALRLRQAIGDRRGEALALRNIGFTYGELNEYEKAREYYTKALALFRVVGDRNSEANVLGDLARVARHHKNLNEAKDLIETSLGIVESTRSAVSSQELRTSYMTTKRDSYDFYVDLLMQLHQDQPSAGHDQMALRASEQARARTLLDLLTEARIDVHKGVDPVLKEKEKASLARISEIQAQFFRAHSQPKPDSSKITALESELKKANEEREQLETEIRQKHPRYAELQYPAPLNLKAIQQLLDGKTVMLEYYLEKDASFLFAISKHNFLAARLPAGSILTNEVKSLRDAVANPNRLALSNYLQKARSLYQKLVEPAAKLLTDKHTLIIVPDGILYYLPFEILLQSDTARKAQNDLSQLKFLIRDFAVSYVPSATVLANLRTYDQKTQTGRKTFLAYGDPVYGKTDPEQTDPVQAAIRSAFDEQKPWQLQRLPASRSEVERIGRLYQPEQIAVFLGEQANEANVKAGDRLGQYTYIHFAVHGLLNENKPQYSGLVLSLPRNESSKMRVGGEAANNVKDTPRPTEVEDGFLQMYEIFNLKLNADLVVLSACETGLGKEVKGEGLIGLTRAFLYAGAPSLIVSLWKIQDRSTAELMVELYRALKNGRLSKAEALRQSKLALIQKRQLAHPYYWAGFVLMGQH